MSHRLTYAIVQLGLSFTLGFSVAAHPAAAQASANTPTDADVYCSGVVSTEAVPGDIYVISGENADYRDVYESNDHVFLNRGAEQGVKVGDEFEVVRATYDYLQYKWFKYQPELSKAMGTVYADIGRLRVVNVLQKTSVAQIEMSCDDMRRGDLVRPFTPRMAPSYHQAQFDPFAPPSGKKTAMVVMTRNFGQVAGLGATVYVNLGGAQGVKVGDYFRVFRYQGDRYSTPYKERGMAYKTYGFGSTPVAYDGKDLPRQVLGEGIVLRIGANAATVLLTMSNQEIYAGDYVELE